MGLWPAGKRLDDSRESDNVEDRASGPRIGGRGTIGIGTIVLALVAMYFGVDPNVVLQMAEGPTAQQQQRSARRRTIRRPVSWPRCSARPRTPGPRSSRTT